jgi:hypothetical protein
MRIGISIITTPGHNIWNNGIGQNVYHLANTLARIPFVEKVFLINTGDQESHAHGVGGIANEYSLLSLAEAKDNIDVAIELSGALDVSWIKRVRATGSKVVYHNCGQPYASLVEPTIFDKPSFFGEAERCDAVWQLPKDNIFNNMMGVIHRCPVYTVPYLWDPIFINQSITDIVDQKTKFGYEKHSLRRGATISIFEPNISTVKMGVIPFMICENVYSKKPKIIKKVNFLNGIEMSAHATFFHLVNRSTLYQKNKLAITPREVFAHTMANGSNVVVAHQLECTDNYAYLDALYGNYPLVHNSPTFSDVGYYYPDCDIETGSASLIEAINSHDRNLENYTRTSKNFINKFSPTNKTNINNYARALLSLT